MSDENKVRLHKFLADCGIASRRRSEELIVEGKVTVNGNPVSELGMLVDPLEDTVMVDGKPVNVTAEKQYILMNKPRGVVTTTVDPEGRQTIIDVLGAFDVRVFPVGRLDYDTEGALLLTNDGELANGLLHPSSEIWKIYEVKVQGVPTRQGLAQLARGLVLEDGPTAPARVRLLEATRANAWIAIGLTGGRYHQVKRMCESIGHRVLKLRRLEFAGLTCEGMNPGEWRYLRPKEVGRLWAMVNAAKAAAQAKKKRAGEHGPGAGEGTTAPAESKLYGFKRKPGAYKRDFGRDGRRFDSDGRPPQERLGDRGEGGFEGGSRPPKRRFGQRGDRGFERQGQGRDDRRGFKGQRGQFNPRDDRRFDQGGRPPQDRHGRPDDRGGGGFERREGDARGFGRKDNRFERRDDRGGDRDERRFDGGDRPPKGDRFKTRRPQDRRGGRPQGRGGFGSDRGGFREKREGFKNDREGFDRGGLNDDRRGFDRDSRGSGSSAGGPRYDKHDDRGGLDQGRRDGRDRRDRRDRKNRFRGKKRFDKNRG